MPSRRRTTVGQVADAIRAYVSAHPAACDSATGIQKWWLPAELANCSTADLAAALAALHAAGVLGETRLPDGEAVYSAAKQPRSVMH